MSQQIPLPPPNQLHRKSSRKWWIVIITLVLIAVLGVALFTYFSSKRQVAGHYETGNLLASNLPQTTGRFTMNSNWILQWWYPVVTGNESLSGQQESELVIVIHDALTSQPIQTVIAYVNVIEQSQTLNITGTFYLSITAPNYVNGHIWYFQITCSTLG